MPLQSIESTALLPWQFINSVDTNYELGISEIDSKNPFFPVDLLLYLTYPLDSKEYLMKKAIINKFGEHGINYQERKSKIPETVLEMIKKIYPETWKKYVAKDSITLLI